MTVTDKTAPKLVSPSSPKKGASEVAIEESIVLTFNESIKVGKTGNITIINTNDADDIRVISVNSSEISTNGKTLSITPAKALHSDSHYTVNIDNTAIQDMSGNKYAGISDATTLYFDTIDTLAPKVKNNPLENKSSIASSSNIVLTFNENIKSGSGYITIESNDGVDKRTIDILDKKQIKISGTTLTINPSVDLNINSTYKVHLDVGAIKDLAPLSHLVAAIDFSFETTASGDKQAPVLSPNTVKSESNKLQLTFQEDIIKGKGSFTLVNSVDSKDKIIIPVSDASITISHNLLTIDSTKINPEKTYLLTAPKGILTDLAKNAYAGLTTNQHFTYHDKTSPMLTIAGNKMSATNSAIL